MSNSVHTNIGATVALHALNKTNSALEGVQKRVSTGFRVADAKDDGAAFAVAQGLRASVKGYEAVGERLSVGSSMLSVAEQGLTGISNSLSDLKGVLVKLTDAALTGAQRTQYAKDYDSIVDDIDNYISQSSFNGTNLLSGTTSVNVVKDLAGGSISLNAYSLATATDLGTAAPTTATAAATLLAGGFADFETDISTAIGTVGANQRSVKNQSDFIGVLGDTVSDGIGAIVDADLSKESAKLQALQIQQQLGTQALSIANQSPSVLLSLFQ